MAGTPLNAKLGQIPPHPLTLFTINAFVLSRFSNHFHRLKMSSGKDSRIALLLIEAARSGVRDPSLRDVVTDYFTHDGLFDTATDRRRRGLTSASR